MANQSLNNMLIVKRDSPSSGSAAEEIHNVSPSHAVSPFFLCIVKNVLHQIFLSQNIGENFSGIRH